MGSLGIEFRVWDGEGRELFGRRGIRSYIRRFRGRRIIGEIVFVF